MVDLDAVERVLIDVGRCDPQGMLDMLDRFASDRQRTPEQNRGNAELRDRVLKVVTS